LKPSPRKKIVLLFSKFILNKKINKIKKRIKIITKKNIYIDLFIFLNIFLKNKIKYH